MTHHMGSMYIGNIHWKHCRLETSLAFGNMDLILETKIGYWKHKKAFGNISFILETQADILETMHLETRKCLSK